jgi:uncharacterized protein (DUF1330 family)
MAKGYWISAYREIIDDGKLAAYAEIAGPAIIASGGRFLARGGRVIPKDAGMDERTVVVEFDSFELAVTVYESDAYKVALEELQDGVIRDFRIVEGVN